MSFKFITVLVPNGNEKSVEKYVTKIKKKKKVYLCSKFVDSVTVIGTENEIDEPRSSSVTFTSHL